MIKRNTLNFVIDIVTLLVALGLVCTGLLMAFILPPGSGRGGAALWAMNRHEWGDVHFWLSMTAIGLVFVHVLLHWHWVCATVWRMFTGPGRGAPTWTKRTLAGVAAVLLLVGIVGGFLAIAAANVTGSTQSIDRHEDHAEYEAVDRPFDERGGGGQGYRRGR